MKANSDGKELSKRNNPPERCSCGEDVRTHQNEGYEDAQQREHKYYEDEGYETQKTIPPNR